MLDLCSGLGGASQPMLDRGWRVIRVDINPRFESDIVTDVQNWTWKGKTPDLIWASPPCVEFARESMPWSRTGRRPSLDIMLACKHIIDETKPRYWVIENVRGAVKWFAPHLGNPRLVFNPYYLWGWFPLFGFDTTGLKSKESYHSSDRDLRALIPYRLAENLAIAVEAQPPLFADVAVMEV